MTNSFMHITLALCIACSAAAQDGTPAAPPVTRSVAAKITPIVPAGGANDSSKTTAVLPGPAQTIDQNAVVFYEKTVAVVRALKAIQLTTKMSASGAEGGMLPQDFLEPTRSTWDLETIEGSPCRRMRIESTRNDKVMRVITFDGTRSLATDNASRSYMENDANWSALLGPAGSGVPHWVFEMHAEEAMPTKVVAAAIIGTETIDGQVCDIVRVSRGVDLGAVGGEEDESPTMMTTTVTIAVARTDSFPRRLSQKMEINGEDQMADIAMSYQYSNVKLDPTLDASMFTTTPPEGYTKGEPPKAKPAGEQEAPTLKAKVGDKALDFTLAGIDGAQVSLEGLKGKVILLDFWATWCGPCKQVMPTIQKISIEYKDKGVVVLGVNTWERGEGAAKKYMDQKEFTYGCLLAGDDLAKSYGVPGIPTLIVIGKDGLIAMAEVGMAPDDGKALRAAIDAALAK